MNHNHKTVQLPTASLDLAREIRTLITTTRDRQNALQVEYQAKADAIREKADTELQSLWAQLHLSAGLPAEEVGEWTLDAKYLDAHGAGFLVRCEREPEGATTEPQTVEALLQSLGAAPTRH